ncbi:MAG: peptidoglycan DD-metalloendopeptidase family protein [Oscillospiraceae bacterium]|nr:peptidoglycan DD-metalloendopeptidase family protein [Oscillospiraceae bacterium]
MRQKRTKWLSAAIAAFAALSLVVGILPAPAYAVTQAEIDELERQKKKLEQQIEEKQAAVDELEKQHADATELKEALDERNVYLVRQIRLNDEQIAIYDAMIAQKAEEVKEAKRLEDEQLERWRNRVRAMEENGNGDYLAMLLNSNSIGEFLTAIDDIGEIMESDKLLEDAYIAARENTERVKADYEKYKAGLEVKKEELEKEQAKLEEEIIEATAQLEKLKQDIEKNSDELDKLNEKEEDTEALIEKKKAELEEQKRREEEARQAAAAAAAGGGGGTYGTVTGSGNFAWPCACTYITSMVGNRLHPISGVWRYHSGMDIGCQYGDAVWASDGGTVILAGVNGGYGNCIIIDHGYVNGDTYSTLYGHLSSIGVSVGQTVSQGQYIGAVGSTGNSTGPHLHFEIRNSSGPTDFSWRFSGLTYAPDSGG